MEVNTSHMDRTTVSVSEDVADELHGMKQRGESYDDVLRRVLGLEDDNTDTGSGEEPGIDTSTPSREEIRDQLRDALAGSGDLLERRVDEVLGMWQFLKEAGEAEKKHMLEEVDVEATGYESEASVWANMIKGRDTLRTLPGVEPPSSGMSTWRYTAEHDEE